MKNLRLILFRFTFILTILVIYFLSSVPESVKSGGVDFHMETPLIIDESKTLVAKIPVGYRQYNLCFGDTLAIVKSKTNITDFHVIYFEDFQLASFNEMLENECESSNELIFENGRLVAFRSKIKNFQGAIDQNEIYSFEDETLNKQFVKRNLSVLNDRNLIYEVSILNII